MTKLFKKKDESQLRSVRRPIKLTAKEDEEIRLAANIRQMDISDFIRCAALGRKADVDFDTEIVLALSELTKVIRLMHTTLVEEGLNAGEELWLPVIEEARAAMLRIGK
jgi:uncharacterized protein (DUF1778 family)